ncbi:hypothetical protein [Streptomyces sp. NBC_00728]|jgi:hypothetical protein|uniref:hypothetical protein n=1 Tax=Streptomyces sp. NBC_00728 TaxID=2903676 RepID=UPI0038695081
MAIDYDLDIATRSSSAEVAAHLAEIGREAGLFDESITGERLADKGTFDHTGLGTCFAWKSTRPESTNGA